ncbi:peptidase M24, structural domain-containing protein [Syncephalastrum racemosum]|uniref:Peptidase M24, structural domain-containing protein n=1 Tax=Syncephalastrum racemosum TaxID=13706 RepID=A0A1X2HAS3_SYNRA|nr:peptidase M24, structural domain-containing protein [Syncephalastrum racemosum]
MKMLPTRQNVQKVLSHFEAKEGLIYLNGQVLHERDDTDVELPFRQESTFFYLTGVSEPDFHVIVDIATQRIELYAPALDPDAVVWMGLPDSIETMKSKYDVDEVLYVTDMAARLSAASVVYTPPIAKKDGLTAQWADEKLNKALYAAICEARAVKADWEVDLIRMANKISSDAHVKVMQMSASNEADMHAVFLYESARHGAFFQSYQPIFGAGKNAATLHYNRNNAPLNNPNDVVLVDAGAEFNCYASDITRTFPVGAKFTPEAAAIYSIVLDMQNACFAKCKAGTPWEVVHETALQVAADGLLKLGILKGDKQELLDNGVVAAFFPHGVGHMLGLDVHDVGGYPEGVAKIDRPGYRYLRMRRTLAAGNVVTVEPGIYFCDFIIDPVLKAVETSKCIDVDMLNKYKSVGGVRIEDNILITEDGYTNLTTAPKEIDQIEALKNDAESAAKKRKAE